MRQFGSRYYEHTEWRVLLSVGALLRWLESNKVEGLSSFPYSKKGPKLAKPNYQYEKRQRDLAKKKKKEEKKQRKLNKTDTPQKDDSDQSLGVGK